MVVFSDFSGFNCPKSANYRTFFVFQIGIDCLGCQRCVALSTQAIYSLWIVINCRLNWCLKDRWFCLFTSFHTGRFISCTIFHFHHISRTKTSQFLNKIPTKYQRYLCMSFFFTTFAALNNQPATGAQLKRWTKQNLISIDYRSIERITA